jgi:DNA invertase Pin-like site-specific DNA recombinase
MKQYAYVRISTVQQNTDRQTIALEGFNIPEERIFTDKQSGKDFNRPAYRKLVKKLQAGDTLIVKSIDRLGRNYDDILKQWQVITKEIRADIVVLDMPLLDTRKKESDITGTFIADLVLQILAYVAQKEREFIVSRTKEGIAAAKARGVRLGRPDKAVPESFDRVFDMWKAGYISAREGARKLGIDHKTFRKWCDRKELSTRWKIQE